MAAPHTVPSGMGEHVPCVPATAHERQAPHDAAPQQTPSTQLPLSHSAPAAQICPSRFLPHEPLLHTVPGTQSLSMAQAERQVVPLQL